jgi:hypothetical protein
VLVFLFLSIARIAAGEQRDLLLVVGAPGEEEYGERFSTSAALWQKAAAQAGFNVVTVGLETPGELDDRTRVLNYLSNAVTNAKDELWIALIGHGTFDGRAAKLNLRGPDLSADELSLALKPCVRPLAVIQCASASGPFLNALSASNRVVITATRSGHEVNATRFGDYFAQAIADPAADLDKDGQTSLLESFLMATRQVQQFYKEEGRLATEHALLDDNGDKLGTQGDWFRGVRAVKSAEGGKSVDGVRAHQLNLVRSYVERELTPEVRARRDALEQQLNTLRARKGNLEEAEYYGELEKILVDLARLYTSNAPPAR